MSSATPSERPVSPAGPKSEPPLPSGAAMGRYVVLEPLGQGAMGIVYRAFDPELDRHIAIKLLRRAPAFASREQERLLREGKAMARLSHPNVVTVYDVGTYGERVFVAMELVDGETLRSWLKRSRSWREVVALFVQAGRGLAAAHAAGIVHRDFKADNALVGADGRVRVLDFGLAWTPDAPQGQDDEPSYRGPFSVRASSAAMSGSLVGTPRYSPPEQIEGRHVDARADQFAFCASLWEGLYGEPPFPGDDLLTLLGNVREGKLRRDPPRGVPGRVVDALRRGLAVEPADRFPSMEALLRVLELDPTQVRRRRLGAAAAVAVALGGIALALGSRIREQRSVCEGSERRLAGIWNADRKAAIGQALAASGKPWAAETASKLADQIDRYTAAWVAMRRDNCEATSVRHEQSAALLDLRTRCLDERAEEVRALTMQLSQPSETLLASAPKAVYAMTSLRGCADTKALLAPVPMPGDPTVRAEVEQVRVALADVKAMNAFGHYADAEKLAGELTGRALALHYAPLEAEVLEEHGNALDNVADYPRAVDSFRQALYAAERGLDRGRAASALVNMVWAVGVDEGHHEQAHEYAAHAGAILAGLGGDPVLEANLASFEAAVLRDEGRLDDAVSRGREAVEKRKIAFGTEHPRYAMALNNLAAVLADQGHYAETLDLAQEATSINARTLGEHHPDYALSLQSLASAFNLVGRPAEARDRAEQALAVLQQALGPDHVRVASAEWSLALIEMKLGKYVDAERHLRHAVGVAESLHGETHGYVGDYVTVLADVLVKEGRNADAVPLYRRAIEILGQGTNAQELGSAQSGLGLALLGLSRPAEAVLALEPALRWQEKDGNARELALTRLRLSRALWATGADRARARRLASLAVEALTGDPGAQDDLHEATTWLAGLPGN